MQRQRKIYIAKTAAIMSVVPVLMWAYSTGPDVGKSGVPGESTCAEAGCHTGTALNGGPGNVKITFPGGLTYTPGVTQHLVVTISDPNQRRWGFQVAARQSGNTSTQAGLFSSTDGNTAVICGASSTDLNPTFLDFGKTQTCPASKFFTYIEHTQAGSSRIQSSSGTYEFDWTPPATDVGAIRIFVAGNAANGDGNSTGDRIYTTSYTLQPGAAGTAPSISPNGVISAGAFGAYTSVAPGSWMEIYGTNFSPTTREWAGADFAGVNAPTSLDGVKVTIDGKLAFVDYISPTQVNAQVPSNVAPGTAQLTVSNASGVSAAYSITVNSLQPGLLAPASFQVGGKQYVVAQTTDGKFVLPTNAIGGISSRPAKPGETIVIYGVGFGPAATTGNVMLPAGQIVQASNQLTNPLTMDFGGTSATLSYAGLAPNFVGLYQFNVVVPTVADNDAVAINVKLNGTAIPQTLFTSVHQ